MIDKNVICIIGQTTIIAFINIAINSNDNIPIIILIDEVSSHRKILFTKHQKIITRMIIPTICSNKGTIKFKVIIFVKK